ncbi:hypothetical protein HZS_6136 [Henneguya salminicola]|nr:hypothetical protein HZS_6136 [Henneguya salminicola]
MLEIIIFSCIINAILKDGKEECPFQLTDAPKYCTLSSDCLKTTCFKYGNLFTVSLNCTHDMMDVSLNKKTVYVKLGDNFVMKERLFNLIIEFEKMEENHRFTIYRALKWCRSKRCYKKYYENYIRSSIKSLCKAWELENTNLSLASLKIFSHDSNKNRPLTQNVTQTNFTNAKFEIILSDPKYIGRKSTESNCGCSSCHSKSKVFIVSVYLITFFLVAGLSLTTAKEVMKYRLRTIKKRSRLLVE